MGPPAKPGDYAATGTSASEILISWSDLSDNEEVFWIQRKVGGSWKNLGSVAANSTEFTDSGLSANTLYEYRVRACNAAGCGSSGNFFGVTLEEGQVAPAATTRAASGISETGATLNGTVNPNGQPTSVHFVWGLQADLSDGASTPVQNVGSGSAEVPVSRSLTGLSASKTYYYRIVAAGPGGSASGSILSFVTAAGSGGGEDPAAPTVTTTAATGLGSTGATLNATVNPRGAATAVHFVWGTKPDLSNGTATAVQNVEAGSSNVSVKRVLTGLTASTTYYYRVVAENSAGSTAGTILSFATTGGGDPSVAPAAPENELATGASDSRMDITWVDASDNEQIFWIQRKINGAWKNRGSVDANVTQFTDDGLSPNTSYEYRVRACNAAGCTSGNRIYGTTLSPGQEAPGVTTTAASAVSATSATLNGTVDPNGASTAVHFVWGRAQDLADGTATPAQNVGSGSSGITVSRDLSGLSPSTTYFYRVVATNGAGQSVGTIQSFTTSSGAPSAPTATTAAANAISTAGGTLNGSVNPQGSATAVHFVWGTDPALVNGTATPVKNVGAGSTNVSVSQALTGLSASTTYYYHIVATNPEGTTSGTVLSFVTSAGGNPNAPPAAPSAGSATGVSDSQILLTWVDESNNEDVFWIQRRVNGAWKNQGSVAANVTQYSDLGLSPNTSYEFRVRACNATGCGSSRAFYGHTLSPGQTGQADLATRAASAIQSRGATLNASVNPNGQSTTLWFEYGTNPSLTGAATSVALSVGSASTPVTRGVSVNGLTPATRYYFRPVVQAGGTTTRGQVGSFVTEPVSGSMVRVVTFGDSNTDHGYSGTNRTVVTSSYISTSSSTRRAFHEPNSNLQLAGKIESGWSGAHPLIAVNHGIGGTTSGSGTTSGAPNALAALSGVSRFQAEVLGAGYLWSGAESGSGYPQGPIDRTLAFTPDGNDFAYISIGTNDPAVGISTSQTIANIQTMINAWISAGHSPNRLIITTLAPRNGSQYNGFPAINAGIRNLAASTGVHLVDLAAHTSNDDGLTWRSSNLHVGDGVHYSESVRSWIAQQIVAHINDVLY